MDLCYLNLPTTKFRTNGLRQSRAHMRQPPRSPGPAPGINDSVIRNRIGFCYNTMLSHGGVGDLQLDLYYWKSFYGLGHRPADFY